MKSGQSRFQSISGLQLVKIFLIFILLFNLCMCDNSTEPRDTTNSTLMAVYPNSGPKITLVDYNTFEVVKQIEVNLPDTLGLNTLCLSSNKEKFIFIASIRQPPFSTYIGSYDITRDTVDNIFPTGLDSVSAPRLSAAHISDEPGLIYLYSHRLGLYSIDFIRQEITLISEEHDQGLGKFFYFTSDKQLAAILKQDGREPAHAEVEFYHSRSGLTDPLFILNEHNRDSIYISDLVFANNEDEILISIRLPEMRYVANNFGSYNLQTKKLFKSALTFPWSLNPYYLAYSSNRNECYTVGASDKFYIIGTDSSNYYIKTVIDLTAKVEGPSRILVRPDENVAFVSCADTNMVFVIDLETRNVLKTISIESAYLMLIL